MAADEVKNLEPVFQGFAELGDFRTIRICGAHRHGHGGKLDAAESLNAVIELADARSLQDYAAEARSDCDKDGAGPRSARESCADFTVRHEPDAFEHVIMRSQEIAHRGVPGAVFRFFEHDGDIPVSLNPSCHEAHVRISARGGDEERLPVFLRISAVAMGNPDFIMINTRILGGSAFAPVFAGDARLGVFFECQGERGNFFHAVRFGGRRESREAGRSQA